MNKEKDVWIEIKKPNYPSNMRLESKQDSCSNHSAQQSDHSRKANKDPQLYSVICINLKIVRSLEGKLKKFLVRLLGV